MPWKMITTECDNWKRKENLFGNLQSKTALQCLLSMPCLVQYECNAYFQLKELHSINYLAEKKIKKSVDYDQVWQQDWNLLLQVLWEKALSW